MEITATDPSLIAWIRLTVDKILPCCFMIWGGDSNSLVILLFEFNMVKHKQHYELSDRMSTPTVFGIYGNSDSGKTTAILEAGHLRVFNESRETLLDDGVKVDFYNEEGKIFIVRCDKFLGECKLITNELKTQTGTLKEYLDLTK